MNYQPRGISDQALQGPASYQSEIGAAEALLKDKDAWNGVGAPAKTPRAIIDKLNAEIKAAVASPDLQKRMLDLGIVPRSTTPEEMTTLLKKDIALWTGVIEKAKIEKQ